MEWKTVMTNFMRLVIFLWIWVCIRRQKNNLRPRKNSILQDMIETCFMGSFSQNTGGKWQEAKDFAERAENMGYEPFVMPLKLKLLEDSCKNSLEIAM